MRVATDERTVQYSTSSRIAADGQGDRTSRMVTAWERHGNWCGKLPDDRTMRERG